MKLPQRYQFDPKYVFKQFTPGITSLTRVTKTSSEIRHKLRRRINISKVMFELSMKGVEEFVIHLQKKHFVLSDDDRIFGY